VKGPKFTEQEVRRQTAEFYCNCSLLVFKKNITVSESSTLHEY